MSNASRFAVSAKSTLVQKGASPPSDGSAEPDANSRRVSSARTAAAKRAAAEELTCLSAIAWRSCGNRRDRADTLIRSTPALRPNRGPLMTGAAVLEATAVPTAISCGAAGEVSVDGLHALEAEEESGMQRPDRR